MKHRILVDHTTEALFICGTYLAKIKLCCLVLSVLHCLISFLVSLVLCRVHICCHSCKCSILLKSAVQLLVTSVQLYTLSFKIYKDHCTMQKILTALLVARAQRKSVNDYMKITSPATWNQHLHESWFFAFGLCWILTLPLPQDEIKFYPNKTVRHLSLPLWFNWRKWQAQDSQRKTKFGAVTKAKLQKLRSSFMLNLVSEIFLQLCIFVQLLLRTSLE